MSTVQYKVLGVVSFLLALCCGIGFFAMRDELARSVGPPARVGPAGVAFMLFGVRLMMKRSPDPNQMNDVGLVKHNFGQTRTAMYMVLGVVGFLDVAIFGVTFLGWDSGSNLSLVGITCLGALFSLCAVLALFVLANIYNPFGGRARALLDRILTSNVPRPVITDSQLSAMRSTASPSTVTVTRTLSALMSQSSVGSWS